jgi:hypothetical protein
MSINVAQSELQHCVVMSFETPSVSIEARRSSDRQSKPGIVMARSSLATLHQEKGGSCLAGTGDQKMVSRRKTAILVAVRIGVITREEACHRYLLSAEAVGGVKPMSDDRIPAVKEKLQLQAMIRQHQSTLTAQQVSVQRVAALRRTTTFDDDPTDPILQYDRDPTDPIRRIPIASSA